MRLATLACGALCLAIAPMASSGCAESAPEGPERTLPAGFEEPVVDGSKSDWLTRWFVYEKGQLSLGEAVKGDTAEHDFVGYAVELQAGDVMAVDVTATDWTLVRVYGPQKPSGLWGGAIEKATTDYVGPGHDFAHLEVEAEKAGTYLIVLGQILWSDLDYKLELGCVEGPCSTPATCGAPEAYPDVTLDDVLSDPKAWIGQQIALTDVAEAFVGCTKIGCPPDVCCNTCSGGLRFSGVPAVANGVSHHVTLEGLSCLGHECTDWSVEGCALPAGSPITAWGTLTESMGHLTLVVDDACEQPAPTEDCVIAGCSGEMCIPPDGDAMSICVYQPWYVCKSWSSCGLFGEGGTCGWESTEGYQACMAQFEEPGCGPEAGEGFQKVTAEAVFADPKLYVGEPVWLTGVMGMNKVCTLGLCQPDVCCDTCKGHLHLTTGPGALELLTDEGGPAKCGTKCEPLCDTMIGLTHQAWGTLVATPEGLALELAGSCAD